MTLHKPSPDITTFKLRKNVTHFGTSLCRGVRNAHVKSAALLSMTGFAILGLIAYLFQ